MTEAPNEITDVTRRGRYNGIVIAVLVAVGLLGAWFMFDNLYPQAPAPTPRLAPPSEAAPAAPSGGSRHVVRLSPFSDVATAEELRARLEKLGIPSSLRTEAHLQVGPFATQAEAEAARARLKEMGVYGGQSITLKP